MITIGKIYKFRYGELEALAKVLSFTDDEVTIIDYVDFIAKATMPRNLFEQIAKEVVKYPSEMYWRLCDPND